MVERGALHLARPAVDADDLHARGAQDYVVGGEYVLTGDRDAAPMRSSPRIGAEACEGGISARRYTTEAEATRGMRTGESVIASAEGTDYRVGGVADGLRQARAGPAARAGSDASPRPRAAHSIAAVDPHKGHAGRARRRAVDGRVVAHVTAWRGERRRASSATCRMRGSGLAKPQPCEVTTVSNSGASPDAARRERWTRSMPLVTTPAGSARRAPQHGRQPGRRSPRAERRSRYVAPRRVARRGRSPISRSRRRKRSSRARAA